MKTASLRFRINLCYVSLLAMALIAFGASVYLGLQKYLESSLKHSLVESSTNIATRFTPGYKQKGSAWLADEVSESYAPEISGLFIRITAILSDGRQEIAYQSGNTQDPHIDTARISHLNRLPDSPDVRVEKPDGRSSLMIYALPFTTADGSHFLIETGASLRPIEQVLRGLLITLIVLTPITLLAAAAIGYLLMSKSLQPVAELTRHAEKIGIDDSGERLPIIASGDELERLSLSLNRMIGRLEDAMAHIRRFSADVSHELRTPLTILRGEFEQLVQKPDLDEGLTDLIGSALEEIDRMSKIVDSLLAISRLDSGGAGIDCTKVDLGEMVTLTTDQMRLLADEKQISIRCLSSGPVEVAGDPAHLKQVVVNLLDNAIKYTPAGGQVSTYAFAEGNFGILEVIDNGTGIPEEAQPHVFERFYRADKARTRGSGGAGLGLSIVQAICSAHAGQVSLTSQEGSGTTMRVALPLFSLTQARELDAAKASPTTINRRTTKYSEDAADAEMHDTIPRG